jgi:DNA-binding beta-propeller fold protein YncE
MKQGQVASAGMGSKRGGRQILVGLAFATGLLASGAATATDPNYVYLSQFGSYGSGDGQFIGPTYALNFVAIDPSTHDIVVEDGGNYRVEIFTSSGTYLRQFGSGPGTGNGQFNGIGGIAIDPLTHNIAVVDGNGRVQIFTWSGNYLSQFGSPGTGDGQFNAPGEIAIDPVSRNIVVSDLGNHRVQIFSAAGVFLGKFGSSAQFSYADYLTIDPTTHNILVGDEINANVQIFTSSGAYLRQFGSYGTGNGQFRNAPGGIAVDPSTHNIIVDDYANNRIQVFDADGNYLSQFGSPGTGDGQFDPTNGPTGLDIDPSTHNVVVLDRGDSRAEIFALSTLPPPPTCGPTPVSLSIQPPMAALSQSILFSAQAIITAPFAGTVSFLVDGTTAAACTANMQDVSAICSHPLSLGTHTIVAQYSGDGHNPPGCSAPQPVTVVADGGQGPTNMTCATTPNPVVQGQPFTTTCGVSIGGNLEALHQDSPDGTDPAGYVTINQGADVLGIVPIFFGTAVYTTVLAGGDYALSATYSGDATNATSTDEIPVVVDVPDDDVFYGGFDIPPG